MTPLVSIVTPSYNQAAFLRQTIESVLSQDYEHIEYFVMDGGSTDGSVEIIRQYESSLTGWRSGKDGGQADAISQGWGQSRGEIVCWLNSDDYYAPGAVRAIVEAFTHDPSVGVVTGDCVVVDEAGQFVRRMPSTPGGFGESHLSGNSLPQPGVFCRRDLVEAAGGINPELKYVMDWDLWLRLWRAGARFACLPRTLAFFRVWPQSKTVAGRIGFAEERLTVYETLLEDARSAGDRRFVQELRSLYSSCLLENALLCQLSGMPDRAMAYFVRAATGPVSVLLSLPHPEALGLQLATASSGVDCSAANFVAALGDACKRTGRRSNPERWKQQLLSATYLVEAWETQYMGAHARSLSYFLRAVAADPRLIFRRAVMSPTLLALASTVGYHSRLAMPGAVTRHGQE